VVQTLNGGGGAQTEWWSHNPHIPFGGNFTSKNKIILLETEHEENCGLTLFRKLGTGGLTNNDSVLLGGSSHKTGTYEIKCWSWREKPGNKEMRGYLGAFLQTRYSTRLRSWSSVGSVVCDGFRVVGCICNHCLSQECNNVIRVVSHKTRHWEKAPDTSRGIASNLSRTRGSLRKWEVHMSFPISTVAWVGARSKGWHHS
jgi:hypothetical protein